MTELPPPPMPTVDAIWRAIEAEARPAYEGYGIGASHLGRECDRALWYGLRWASPPEPMTGRKLRIFERGDIEEGRVIRDLRLAGLMVEEADPRTRRQWAFALADGWLRGRADGIVSGVIEAPKATHVLEVKSLKAADWRAILKHGLLKSKPEHWHQLHAGMAGLGIARGLYVGVNKDSEEILTERVRLDAEEASRQEARVLRIVHADHAPAPISDNPDAFACRLCDHRAVCHRGDRARRHCRTCLHWSFGRDGHGFCERWQEPRGPQAQARGCDRHLYLPSLVAGEQIDASLSDETVTYRMADGSEWTDGLPSTSPEPCEAQP